MKSTKLTKPSRQARTSSFAKVAELDHHLVSNRGFWWVCCSINATPQTKEKLGFSLGTKCVVTARLRRDVFLNGLHARGLEVRIRRHSSVTLDDLDLASQHAAVPWKKRVEAALANARNAGVGSDDGAVTFSNPKPRPARRVCCV